MSRRKPEPATDVEMATGPVVTRERKPMRDADAFRPSSFASRKAGAQQRNALLAQRRLVSLGESEFRQRNQRTGETEYLPAEVLMNLDHPVERFVTIAGVGALIPLQSDERRDEVTTLPALRRRTRGPSMLHDPAPADPPPYPA